MTPLNDGGLNGLAAFNLKDAELSKTNVLTQNSKRKYSEYIPKIKQKKKIRNSIRGF